MFNDKFLLTKAVLDGRKTQTRRLLTLALHKKADVGNELIEVYPSKVFFEDGKWKFVYDDYVFLLPKKNYPKYNVGEVVAVAQSYKDIFFAFCQTPCPQLNVIVKNPTYTAGWINKKFVQAEAMPHQIRITDVRVERLQDISDECCLKEGVMRWDAGQKDIPFFCYPNSAKCDYDTPQEAFANLINKVSRKDVWNENPYVFVYDFELVK